MLSAVSSKKSVNYICVTTNLKTTYAYVLVYMVFLSHSSLVLQIWHESPIPYQLGNELNDVILVHGQNVLDVTVHMFIPEWYHSLLG